MLELAVGEEGEEEEEDEEEANARIHLIFIRI